jgi:amino acid transporter
MLCCAVAYHRLNNLQASADAPVRWVARGLSPIIGFAVGILVLMTALTSNIGNITLIGSTVLSLIAPGETSNKPLTWVVATVVCLLVVAIAVIGVKVTIRFEGWVILVEYMIIASLAIWGLETELTSHGSGITAPSWSWFTVSHAPGGSTGLIAGVVIATFLLGGWDSPIYLGDEQRRQRDPGRSVLISITFCTLWVIFLFICLQGLAPAGAITANASNVLPFLAGRLGPKAFSDLVALAVIASFATTIQSQIVDGSRIMFGMSRDRTVPPRLGRVSRFRTPVAGLVVMGVIPVLALVLYLASSSLEKTIVYIDSTGGLLFAGYPSTPTPESFPCPLTWTPGSLFCPRWPTSAAGRCYTACTSPRPPKAATMTSCRPKRPSSYPLPNRSSAGPSPFCSLAWWHAGWFRWPAGWLADFGPDPSHNLES